MKNISISKKTRYITFVGLLFNVAAIGYLMYQIYLPNLNIPNISKIHAQAAADQVTIDTSTVLHTIPPDFFGVNYVGFWDSAQGSAASAQAFSQTPIKSYRFPGGDPGDWYDWQDPYYQGWSSTSSLDLWNYIQEAGGLSALFQTNYQGNLPNPPGQTYAVNSPQNAGAWAAYNKSKGIQAYMEVGNEEDIKMQSVHDSVFQPYITAFNAQAQAMHQANSSVKAIGPAGTNEWYWWALDSLGMFLQQTGNKTGTGQTDGVSLHYYKGSGWSDTFNVPQTWESAGSDWQFIQNTIQADDTRNLPVYITEWNLGDSDSGTGFNQTLGHALVIDDMIGAFAHSGVAQEDYFDIHAGGQFGLLYGTGENNPVDSPTPTYYAMALWGKMGKHVLSLTQSQDPSSTVSMYATKKDDGSVQIMAINKQAQTNPINVNFNNFNPTGNNVSIYDLTGSSSSNTDQSVVYNGVTMPSPQQTLPGAHNTITLSSSTLSYTLPAYSIVVFDIAPSNVIPSVTPTPSGVPSPTVSTLTNTYDATISLNGIKDSSITGILVNGSANGVSYPDSTHWTINENLNIGNNSFTITGENTNGQSPQVNFIINRHEQGNVKGYGVVDLTDLSMFAKDWHRGSSYNLPLYNSLSDINGDGNVDLTDLSILARNWGK